MENDFIKEALPLRVGGYYPPFGLLVGHVWPTPRF